MSFIGNAIGKIVGGITGANQAADAAQGASQTQAKAAQLGIDANNQQLGSFQSLLNPYINAGTNALTGQQNLLGLNGNGAQQSAIDGIQGGAGFQSLLQQGNQNILGNASATGGLRGGNVQSALGQFAPALLSQEIQKMLSSYGGLSTMGANAAGALGQAGLQTGTNIAGLLNQQGAATAGGQIAQGGTVANSFNTLGSLAGAFVGAGGLPGIKKLF